MLPVSDKSTSLRSRVLHAGSWTLGGHALGQVLRLAANLLMTRLLVPEMFGVMAVATIFLVGLTLFSDLGLKQVVIQSRRSEDALFLNTVWVVQILRGVFIFLLVLLFAWGLLQAIENAWLPPGSTYANPELPRVLAWLAISPLISGFESTKLQTANRNLNLSRVVSIEFWSQLSGILTMVLWAMNSPSLSAMVAGALVSALVKTVLSHIWLQGITNGLAWDAVAAREIVNFGKWIFATSIIGFLISNGDRLIVGWLIPAESMGVYAIAMLLAGAMQDVVQKIIGSVVFPALGKVSRETPHRLKELYYRLRLPVDAFCLLLAGFVAVAGQSIVHILYDHRYAGAGPLLQILALNLVLLRFSVAGQLYLVSGQPRGMALQMFSRLLSIFLFIPLGFNFAGLPGAALGVVLAGVPEFLIVFFGIKRSMGLIDYRLEFRNFLILPLGMLSGWFFLLFVENVFHK